MDELPGSFRLHAEYREAIKKYMADSGHGYNFALNQLIKKGIAALAKDEKPATLEDIRALYKKLEKESESKKDAMIRHLPRI